jgi:MFS superfamily sulfate permease-like transporter
MIAATIAPLLLANGDPARAVVLASLLAVLVGVVMVIAGLAKFGFVADLLSKPTQIGYMNGLALTIIVSQLPKLLGFRWTPTGSLPKPAPSCSGWRRARRMRRLQSSESCHSSASCCSIS